MRAINTLKIVIFTPQSLFVIPLIIILCAFGIFFIVVDRQQKIDHLLGYTINHVHKIQEYIDYMYH